MKTQHTLRKGDRLVVEIESIAAGGEGVAKPHGVPVFVSRVAPGDRVEIELFDVRKNFAFGKSLRLIEPAPTRAEPPCRMFKVCGGCHWQHIGYKHQVDLKTDLVRQAIKHIGGLNPDLVKPAVPADEPLFYRNKVQYPVASPANSSRILAGYYKEGSHELVNIKHCPVQPEPLDRLLEQSKAVIEDNRLAAYRERDHSGVIRHIAARYSFAFNEVLATIVVNSQDTRSRDTMKRLTDAAHQLMERVPELIGVCVNFNPEKGNRIMGPQWQLLAGKDHLQEQIRSTSTNATQQQRDGLIFKLTPMSFFQVNTAQSTKLLELVYDAVLTHHSAERPGLIVDAYGGVGTIAFWLSSFAERLICIEEVEAAIKDGREIANLNDVKNTTFVHGRVEEILPQLAQSERIDVVILDPPRKGVAPSVIETIVRSKAPLIIYVSCNPTTLARDLKLLAENGYQVQSIQPLDMFPQTHHVESICVVTAGQDTLGSF